MRDDTDSPLSLVVCDYEEPHNGNPWEAGFTEFLRHKGYRIVKLHEMGTWKADENPYEYDGFPVYVVAEEL